MNRINYKKGISLLLAFVMQSMIWAEVMPVPTVHAEAGAIAEADIHIEELAEAETPEEPDRVMGWTMQEEQSQNPDVNQTSGQTFDSASGDTSGQTQDPALNQTSEQTSELTQFSASNIPSAPKNTLARGVDISHHNKDIDFAALKKDVDFVIIRCGYGQNKTSQDDRKFEQNIKSCRDNDIPYGIYLYSYATSPYGNGGDNEGGYGEAKHTLRLLKKCEEWGTKPSLPIFYDIEDPTISKAISNKTLNLTAMVKAYSQPLVEAGYQVGVYSSTSWWNQYQTDPYYDNCVRWVAEWKDKCNYKKDYAIWQCTASAYVAGISGRCDFNYMVKDVRGIQHHYKKSRKEPTCTEKGGIVYTCKDVHDTGVCNDSYMISETAALGHDWDEGVVTVKPGCTAAGEKTYSCKNGCGKTRTEAVEAIGHSWDEGTVTVAAGCTGPGEKIHFCKNGCGESYTEILDVAGHSWDEGTITTEPGCVTEGVKTYHCINGCGESYTESVPAIGHNWDKTGEVTKNPTCTETGVKMYQCTNGCGESRTETIAETGHDWNTTGKVTKKATCTKSGEKTYTCKNGCGKTHAEKIAATGHTWVNGKVTKKATCTKTGVKTYTCKNGCGKTHTEKLAALGHIWNKGTVTKKATISSTGTKKYTCTRCKTTKTTAIARLTAVKKITITGMSERIAEGKKITLTANISPANASRKTVTWKSSDPKLASVSADGIVTMKKGSAGRLVTITATAKDGSGKKASYKIRSMKGIVKKVTVSGKASAKAGKTVTLKAKVTATAGAQTRIKWVSSNKKYATVTSSGKVTLKSAGKGKKVTITARAVDGSGCKDTITIAIK